MTRLERKVKRSVPGGRRSFVVILHPAEGERPASIELREARARRGYAVTVEGMYRMLADRAVENRRAARRGVRRGRVGAGR